MLIVSSTEPRTLRNGDPPPFQRLPTDKDSRTVPLRPMPRLAVQGRPLLQFFHYICWPVSTGFDSARQPGASGIRKSAGNP